MQIPQQVSFCFVSEKRSDVSMPLLMSAFTTDKKAKTKRWFWYDIFLLWTAHAFLKRLQWDFEPQFPFWSDSSCNLLIRCTISPLCSSGKLWYSLSLQHSSAWQGGDIPSYSLWIVHSGNPQPSAAPFQVHIGLNKVIFPFERTRSQQHPHFLLDVLID